MLIEITFKCQGEDLLPKVAKFSPDDRAWFEEKCRAKGKSLKMNLDETVRMLKAFDITEEIYFEVR